MPRCEGGAADERARAPPAHRAAYKTSASKHPRRRSPCERTADGELESWSGYATEVWSGVPLPTYESSVQSMDAAAFFEAAAYGPTAASRARFLEHDLVRWAPDDGSGTAATAAAVQHVSNSPLGDLRGINSPRLQLINGAARFGRPVRTTLLVSGRCTGEGSCTWLRHDPCDQLLLQLTGMRTLLLFPPSAAGQLRPFPVHHPLDRSAATYDTSTLATKHGAKVVLHPGDALFLPAWWWYQIQFEETCGDELGISVAMVWDAAGRFSTLATLPVPPPLRIELARQLEIVISDALGDAPEHVLPMMRALRLQLGEPPPPPVTWSHVEAQCPSYVPVGEWVGLFEWIVWKLSLLLGAHQLAAFVRDLCSEMRFDVLVDTSLAATSRREHAETATATPR